MRRYDTNSVYEHRRDVLEALASLQAALGGQSLRAFLADTSPDATLSIQSGAVTCVRRAHAFVNTVAGAVACSVLAPEPTAIFVKDPVGRADAYKLIPVRQDVEIAPLYVQSTLFRFGQRIEYRRHHILAQRGGQILRLMSLDHTVADPESGEVWRRDAKVKILYELPPLHYAYIAAQDCYLDDEYPQNESRVQVECKSSSGPEQTWPMGETPSGKGVMVMALSYATAASSYAVMTSAIADMLAE